MVRKTRLVKLQIGPVLVVAFANFMMLDRHDYSCIVVSMVNGRKVCGFVKLDKVVWGGLDHFTHC